MNKRLINTILGFALTANAMASTFQGNIEEISFSSGETPTRVGIRVAPHNSECSGFGGVYYSYENADTGIGKIWTSAILTAYAAQKTVLIKGTGTCDPWGIEKVLHINLK